MRFYALPSVTAENREHGGWLEPVALTQLSRRKRSLQGPYLHDLRLRELRQPAAPDILGMSDRLHVSGIDAVSIPAPSFLDMVEVHARRDRSDVPLIHKPVRTLRSTIASRHRIAAGIGTSLPDPAAGFGVDDIAKRVCSPDVAIDVAHRMTTDIAIATIRIRRNGRSLSATTKAKPGRIRRRDIDRTRRSPELRRARGAPAGRRRDSATAIWTGLFVRLGLHRMTSYVGLKVPSPGAPSRAAGPFASFHYRTSRAPAREAWR